ncbi:MAG: hypothetical protein LUG52_09075 [Clostridia bacterium]|nr:hypothetical protein [Clostridia bacterium]
MNDMRTCMVGHDDDNGWIFAIIIAVIVIAIICTVIVYGGAFIGGYHSIKNYILAFKHNVVDSNRKAVAA